MEHLTWQTAYEDACERFGGQTPSAHLETQLLSTWETRPTTFAAVVDKLAERFALGKIHSPWPLMLKELAEEPDRSQPANPGQERERALKKAEALIRSNGPHIPTETEALSMLFDQTGREKGGAEGILEPYDNQKLRDRFAAQWARERPRGERAEREQLERAERWKTQNHPATPTTQDTIDWTATP